MARKHIHLKMRSCRSPRQPSTTNLPRSRPSLRIAALGAIAVAQIALAQVEYPVENYDHFLTYRDCGHNQFGGNSGGVGGFSPCVESTRTHNLSSESANGDGRSLHLDFSLPELHRPVGVFFSLAGLTDTQVLLDDGVVRTVAFPRNTVDLDDFYRSEHSGFPVVTLDELRFKTRHNQLALGPYRIKVILKSADGEEATYFVDVPNADSQWHEHTAPLLDFQTTGDFSRTSVKELLFILERTAETDNPTAIDLLIDEIELVDVDGEMPDYSGMDDTALLQAIARTTYLYFLDNLSTNDSSSGFVQDRSTFNDTLTVGGLGFSLSALVIADFEGWIDHEEVVDRVLDTLTILADDDLQGPAPAGKAGYKGFFYHLLGVDGKRKLNFDRTETADTDESRTTVELSTIDTALALMGVIVAKNHFAAGTAKEVAIRERAYHILRRVDWPFMLRTDPVPHHRRNQLYLSWKPDEVRDSLPAYEIPDAHGRGHYAGRASSATCPDEEDPGTLDFYTDESSLALLLGMASPNPEHQLSLDVWHATRRKVELEDGGFVKTFPGSLFTYLFASSWIDWRFLGTDNHPAIPLDVHENASRAISASIANTAARADATCNTLESADGSAENRFCTYAAGPVGLTAVEGPDARYRAYTDPVAGIRTFEGCDGVPVPAFHMDDGTVAPYGAGASLLHAPAQAISALRSYMAVAGVWSPRFGFADAFNMDPAFVGLIVPEGEPSIDTDAMLDAAPLISTSRPWVNPARFAIDQGPLLLAIHNYLTRTSGRPGYIQGLVMSDPDIARALNTIYPAQVTPAASAAQRSIRHLGRVQDEFHSRFPIYDDVSSPGNHFHKFAFIGDSLDAVSVDGSSVEFPASGATAIKFEFVDGVGATQAGVYFQNGILPSGTLAPEVNFGCTAGAGIDLTGATTLTFRARGAEGGEIIDFFVGGVGRDAVTGAPDNDCDPPSAEFTPGSSPRHPAIGSKFTLSEDWQQISIDLSGMDLSYVLGGLGWFATDADNPGGATFYLDEIRFELGGDALAGRLDEPRFLRSFATKPFQSRPTPVDDFDLVFRNLAFSYDNALALLAFLAEGSPDSIRRARLIGDAFSYAVENDRFYQDGRVRTAYAAGDLTLPPGWTPNGRTGTVPISGYYVEQGEEFVEVEQGSEDVGNNAWVMIALLALSRATGESDYLDAARTIGEFIQTFKRSTGTYQGFLGRLNAEEAGSPEVQPWASTEHNLDVLAAFTTMYEITGEVAWQLDAAHAQAFVEAMFDATRGCYLTGTTDEDTRNESPSQLPLDAQSWGVLARPALTHRHPSLLACAEAHHRLEDEDFLGFDFNENRDGIWFEGTAQMAAAYRLAGDEAGALELISELRTAQITPPYGDGFGISAASRDGVDTGFGFDLFRRLHIAEAAWHVFAETGFNPFYDFASRDTDADGVPDYRDLDDDGDGLPDSVEQGLVGLDPLDPSDAHRDLDHDGSSNLEEHRAGTPLDDAAGKPRRPHPLEPPLDSEPTDEPTVDPAR